MDFHSESNRTSYATRQADDGWGRRLGEFLDLNGLDAVDLGCGGGIYSMALMERGVRSVIGVDSSAMMLSAAAEHCRGKDGITFVQGQADATGLPAESCDVLLERALIHHLSDLQPNLAEAKRLLRPGGYLVVQDRTPEDVKQTGSRTHIRGYFFERYPRLIAAEASRRRTGSEVSGALAREGFETVRSTTLWEVRRTYAGMGELEQDLANRTGRSILHQLSDPELDDLIAYIRARVEEGGEGPIVEQDRWTIWIARKPL